MGKSELIDCFNDTLKLSDCGSLRAATLKAKKSNKVYTEARRYLFRLKRMSRCVFSR